MKLEKYGSISDASLKKHLSLVGFMLEKLKYIEQFKKNIFNLQTKLQKQLQFLINNTEKIMEEQDNNKKKVKQIVKEIVRADA